MGIFINEVVVTKDELGAAQMACNDFEGPSPNGDGSVSMVPPTAVYRSLVFTLSLGLPGT